MKSLKGLWLLIPLLSLFLATTTFSNDTDLYMASGEGVEPNILILFDNSGSMNEEVQAYYYYNSITYDPLIVPTANRDTVYYKNTSGGWTTFKDSISQVACSSAITALTSAGHYEGYTDSSCKRYYRTLRTGNYRNYLASINYDETRPKIYIAKKVIKEFLDTVHGVRIGLFVFNYNCDGCAEEGGRLHSEMRSLDDTTRANLKTEVDAISAQTWTPLSETLYEIGLYFQGKPSYFNSGVTYTSPIQYHCQKNYVIIITDGKPTQDRNSVLKDGATKNGVVYPKIGDRDGDKREPIGAVNDPHYPDNGSDFLDDVAKYLYDSDLRTDMTGQQNIVTYTIGFTINSDILERTATHGHGKYYYCNNYQELSNQFQNIIADILSKTSSFVAPIVPVSRMERTTAGDKLYLALFKPIQNGSWLGNVKKYGVTQQDDSSVGIRTGDILDATGKKALDSNGQFLSTTKSYWNDVYDGGEVESGGVGEGLTRRTAPRKIYTYFGAQVDLTNGDNAFATGNSNITPTVLGLDAADTIGRSALVQYVHGYDSYDDNGNGNTSEKRDWILGSFLHSRPFIIHYGKTRSVIFAGSNSGMLHAFDDATGEELWAFVPPNLLNKLKTLHADVLQIFVDGSPKAYIEYDTNGYLNKAILIFGQRRGGNRYYALDVTNPDVPKYLWHINPDDPTSELSEMGESWASPVIGKIGLSTGDKWVAFIGGGYDTNQDNDPATTGDTKGRGIYVVDVLSGAKIWCYTNAEDANMLYSIPSDIAKVDTDGNGRVDRLYVGDMGGGIWRFDIGDPDPANWTGKIIFKANPGGSERRKIFYPPDVTLERDTQNFEMLFFGTGDREHPKENQVFNRIYAVKDKNPSTPLTETDLEDVTADLLQVGTPEQKAQTQNNLASKSGWVINLDTGEKVLSTPAIFYKVAYFTTFTPSSGGTSGDPCYAGEGIAKLYALRYNNGNAVFNLDVTNDTGGQAVLAKSDRSMVVGTAIPSSVIITFIGGTAVAYTGVGGGIVTPQLACTKSLVPMSWRIVF